MRSEPGRDHRSTDGGVVTQQARNLLMTLADRADGIKFLLRDQDTTFTAAFNAAFTAVGVRIIKTPVQAPRANAIAERWIASMPITMMSIARIGRSTRTRPPDASIRPPGHECPAPATGPARWPDPRIHPGRVR